MSGKNISKIVITGGPCAGKTTAMSWIQNAFTQLGYKVLFISETATDLISGGLAPWTCGTNKEFQQILINLQLFKEKSFILGAETMDADKILIVCDRGILDNKSYMTEEEFDDIVDSLGTSEIELRDHYDAVFHLVTAAKGAEEFYSLGNNKARTETIEEACLMDDKLISAWTGHPHLRIIDNSIDFDLKMNRLISEISSFLGEPQPYEIEKKYLISYPDIEKLESMPNCQKIEIIQTYLKSSDADTETRVRQRGIDGNYIYFKTVKKKVSDEKRIETEKRLTQEEYLAALMEADTSLKQIRKTRYCLTYNHLYFEIDLYPFWDDKAIMEIELNSEKDSLVFPPFINIIKEVTSDEAYKNKALAKK